LNAYVFKIAKPGQQRISREATYVGQSFWPSQKVSLRHPKSVLLPVIMKISTLQNSKGLLIILPDTLCKIGECNHGKTVRSGVSKIFPSEAYLDRSLELGRRKKAEKTLAGLEAEKV